MEKSKPILGLKNPRFFSLEERRQIIEEWQQSGKTKREIWEKYTGRVEEKGRIFRWMRELGLDISKKQTILNPVKSDNMAKSKNDTSSEVLEMQEKIKALEKALLNSELRATAYETMIEIAEKELKINIRKKSNTKQSIR
jgi:DNA-binding transcriptional MerR regulator